MDVHVEVAAETLFNIGPIPVTNSMLTMFIVMAIILFVMIRVARGMNEVPGRFQGLVEMVVEFLLGLVESATSSRRSARTVFPLVGGIFIFIAIANYSGLLPGVGTIGIDRTEHEQATIEGETVTEEGAAVYDIASTVAGAVSTSSVSAADEGAHTVLVPFFRAPNADINMTLAMALVTFTVVEVAGVRALGFRGRIKHMATPAFIFPIEVVSELARIISLSARLFGNVFAGEVLLGVMYAMAEAIKLVIIPLALPVVFLFLEFMFGTIQALVFALLTLIYITMATEGGHDEHETEHEHGHAAVPAAPVPVPAPGD